MVYVFDPTSCEEPTLPTYRYSPIPKAVECSCCPEVVNDGEDVPDDTKPTEVKPIENNPVELMPPAIDLY